MTITSSPVVPASAAKFETLQIEVRRILAVYAEHPEREDVWQELLKVRRDLAAVIAGLPAGQKTGPLVVAACAVLHAFEDSGAADQSATDEDRALAEQYRRHNWPGLLASMLLVPAWQSPAAPLLDDVQPWLWAEYTRWLFYTPKGFAAVGQATAYAAHSLKRLEELAAWGARNRGSGAVRIALQVYMRGNNCVPLYFDTGSLKHHYELRARILAAAIGIGPQTDLLALPREGRRLRVGFVNRHFGPQTETYTTLPTFEQLDPDRFEVVLFAHKSTGTPLENYARDHASDFRLLSGDLATQVEALRAACLDVVVFGTNVTAVCHEVTQLALHRVAPLQVINNSSCTTSGMPEIDLYVSGDLTEAPEAAEQFSERLGLLPGPAHAFNYEADRQAPSSQWTRAALGLPEDAVVFVTAANYYKIIPEMEEAWARLLAAVPGSRLLIHPFNPNWSSHYPIKRFCAEFDRVLTKHGVDNGRLVISSVKFPSRVDVKELLSVGDIYLDTYPFGGVNSLVDPLEAGIPVVTWEGRTFRSRMGAALLRSLKLDELCTNDADSYQALAVKLASDADARKKLRERIQALMVRIPIFLDTLAHSEAFGLLLEHAYDELATVGREEFRRTRPPITSPKESKPAAALADGFSHLDIGMLAEAAECANRVLASTPASPDARHLLGRVFAAQGKVERAVTYLLAAVQQAENNAKLWLDLAQALRVSGRKSEAVQALETSLRIDGQNLDSWFMLVELAEQVGQTEMVREALQAMKQIAPEDPRVMAKAALAGVD